MPNDPKLTAAQSRLDSALWTNEKRTPPDVVGTSYNIRQAKAQIKAVQDAPEPPAPEPEIVVVERPPLVTARPIAPIDPASTFRRNIRGVTELHPNSDAIVAELVRQTKAAYGGGAALNVSQYNVAYYRVGPETPRVRIRFRKEYPFQPHWPDPKEYYTDDTDGQAEGGWGAAHFVDVPMPKGAKPTVGTDGQIALHDPVADTLHEFWKLEEDPDGTYSARSGGRIDNFSQSVSCAFPKGLGVSASGLATATLCAGINETIQAVVKGTGLGHAISFATLQAAAGIQSWPANRNDGLTPGNLIVQGLRFRLKSSYDVEASRMNPVAKVFARTMQENGGYPIDKAFRVGFTVETGAPLAEHGLSAWGALLAGMGSYAVFDHFPFEELEVLPFDWGKPA